MCVCVPATSFLCKAACFFTLLRNVIHPDPSSFHQHAAKNERGARTANLVKGRLPIHTHTHTQRESKQRQDRFARSVTGFGVYGQLMWQEREREGHDKGGGGQAEGLPSLAPRASTASHNFHADWKWDGGIVAAAG